MSFDQSREEPNKALEPTTVAHLERWAKDTMSKERQSPFTGPGKTLFLASVGIGCAGFYWVFIHLLPNLPSGSYPIFYLLGPVIIVAVLFFFGVAAILRKKGIAVLVSEQKEIEDAKRGFDAKKQEAKK